MRLLGLSVLLFACTASVCVCVCECECECECVCVCVCVAHTITARQLCYQQSIDTHSTHITANLYVPPVCARVCVGVGVGVCVCVCVYVDVCSTHQHNKASS